MQISSENQLFKRYRIGLFGHYGQNNLGDEAVILSVVQNLRERLPGVELVGLSMDPVDTHSRYEIESFPIRISVANNLDSTSSGNNVPVPGEKPGVSSGMTRRIKDLIPLRTRYSLSGFIQLFRKLGSEVQFLRDTRTRLKGMDVLIICGSGQLEDFGGPWGYPYTILKWVLLAKKTNTKVFIVSIGAGPPTYRLSYWMYRKVLNSADYISYRDNWSKNKIEGKIPGVNGIVYPDLAHSLKARRVTREADGGRKTVAINLMPAFDKVLMKGADRAKLVTYIENVTHLVRHSLLGGFKVNLFNSDSQDPLVIDEVVTRIESMRDLDTERGHLKVIHNETVQNLMDTLSGADLVVATRFHSTILPLKLGKPVLGLCYHIKSKEVLEALGLGRYYVDIYDFTAEELCAKFDRLYADLDEVREELEIKYKHIPEIMDDQWDHLVELIRNEEQNKMSSHQLKVSA